MQKKQLFESSEDYLERILILSEKSGAVHSIDLAKDLSFSKASVSVAIHKLKDSGYVSINKDGELKLTNSGKIAAQKTYEKHLVIKAALMKLGVDEETASKDACKIEHDISEKTFKALKKLI